jgi:hypothetical protein
MRRISSHLVEGDKRHIGNIGKCGGSRKFLENVGKMAVTANRVTSGKISELYDSRVYLNIAIS